MTANWSGKVRRETLHGRDYLVAPASLIAPGVLNGSQGALLYPEDEVARNPHDWNHFPIVLGHPTANGVNVTARDPAVLEKYGLGYVFRATFNGKLAAECWFDTLATQRNAPAVLQALRDGTKLEISTGLFTENSPAPADAIHNGAGGPKPYAFVARNYRPDHLAVFHDGTVGACSVRDGCGVFNAFCPTGAGGGQDNSCSSHGDGGTPAADTLELKTPAEYEKRLPQEYKDAKRYGLKRDKAESLADRMLKDGIDAVPQKDNTGYKVVVRDMLVHDLSKHANHYFGPNATEAVQALKGTDPLGFKAAADMAEEHGKPAAAARIRSYAESVTFEARRYALTGNQAEPAMSYKCPSCGETMDSIPKDGKCPKCGKAMPEDKAAMNQAKAANVAYLTANCECWKGGEAALNALPDERLAALRADAERAKANELAVNAAKAPAPVATPVVNATRLTAEEQEDLAFAREEKTKQKQAVVRQLLANVSDDATRQAKAAKLMTLNLDDLREQLSLHPAPAANNAQPAAPMNWLGAAGGYSPTGNAISDESADVLRVPEFDYARNPFVKQA